MAEPTPESIEARIHAEFEGVHVTHKDGDSFFSCDPQVMFPFATIVTHDYAEFDEASRLNRDGVFRLNIGLTRDQFRERFGTGDLSVDPEALNVLFPHPTYARQFWASILNPTEATLDNLWPILTDAYQRDAKKHLNQA